MGSQEQRRKAENIGRTERRPRNHSISELSGRCKHPVHFPSTNVARYIEPVKLLYTHHAHIHCTLTPHILHTHTPSDEYTSHTHTTQTHIPHKHTPHTHHTGAHTTHTPHRCTHSGTPVRHAGSLISYHILRGKES